MVEEEKITTVRVKESTRKKLEKLRSVEGETMDSIINRLIDNQKKKVAE